MNEKSKPLVTCPHCQGKGHIRLTDPLASTLELIPFKTGTNVEPLDGVTCHGILKILQSRGNGDQYISHEAVCNRFAALRDLGFIAIIERRGRTNYWKRTK